MRQVKRDSSIRLRSDVTVTEPVVPFLPLEGRRTVLISLIFCDTELTRISLQTFCFDERFEFDGLCRDWSTFSGLECVATPLPYHQSS